MMAAQCDPISLTLYFNIVTFIYIAYIHKYKSTSIFFLLYKRYFSIYTISTFLFKYNLTIYFGDFFPNQYIQSFFILFNRCIVFHCKFWIGIIYFASNPVAGQVGCFQSFSVINNTTLRILCK